MATTMKRAWKLRKILIFSSNNLAFLLDLSQRLPNFLLSVCQKIVMATFFFHSFFHHMHSTPTTNFHTVFLFCFAEEFSAHGANVNCLALGSKSGRVLVTGGDDKKVNLWAIGKPSCIMVNTITFLQFL
jgi:WD40 repeat protein